MVRSKNSRRKFLLEYSKEKGDFDDVGESEALANDYDELRKGVCKDLGYSTKQLLESPQAEKAE